MSLKAVDADVVMNKDPEGGNWEKLALRYSKAGDLKPAVKHPELLPAQSEIQQVTLRQKLSAVIHTSDDFPPDTTLHIRSQGPSFKPEELQEIATKLQSMGITGAEKVTPEILAETLKEAKGQITGKPAEWREFAGSEQGKASRYL